MRIYPEATTHHLEFERIRTLLADRCLGPNGKEICLQLNPSSSFKEIERRCAFTAEAIAMDANGNPMPFSAYNPLSETLDTLHVPDAVLSTDELDGLRRNLEIAESLDRFFAKKTEEFPVHAEHVSNLGYLPEVKQLIDQVIDQHKEVKSSASKELQKIRKSMADTRKNIDREFKKCLQSLRKLGFLAEIAESVRSNRRVIAVASEQKRRIKGIVHDESDSGKTTFIEPEETVWLNNELAELFREEKREIHRILQQLTRDLVPYADWIAAWDKALGLLDHNRAKASLAIHMEASIPSLSSKPMLDLMVAYHPLLFLKNRAEKKATVPLSARLDKKQRVIVISGPNAGGKSVCLKTIGLLTIMLQSGLAVPADPDSVFGVFDGLFTDIGDAQSIEDELSTYSSRLKHMEYFLRFADGNTLFLIDEFGTGTDPDLGGAVAEAILEELRKTKALGAVTTHYKNLKVYANDAEGVVNARMKFDEEALEPMYELEIGQPGSSFTFYIASRVGLPENVVESARSKVDQHHLDMENLLSELREEKTKVSKEKREIEKTSKQVEALQKDLDERRKRVEALRQKIQSDQHSAELKAIEKLEKEFNKLFDDFRNSKKKEKSAQEIKKVIYKSKEKVKTKKKRSEKKIHYRKSAKKIAPDEYVRILSNNQVGKIAEIKGKKARVQIGMLETWVETSDLVVVEKSDPKAKRPKRTNHLHAAADFSYQLDIRGMRKDEAEAHLQQYLDEALVAKADFARIIHGKGTGELRKLVHRQLKKEKFVESYAVEEESAGGDGVTRVKFKVK